MFCLKIKKIRKHFNSDNLLIKSHTCHALSFVDKSTLLQKMADPCFITENVQYHSYFLETRTNRNVSLIYSVTDWCTKTQRITVHVQGASTPRKVLPITYDGLYGKWHHSKGISFSGFRYMKGLENLSFWSVKRPKGLTNVLFIYFFIYSY